MKSYMCPYCKTKHKIEYDAGYMTVIMPMKVQEEVYYKEDEPA